MLENLLCWKGKVKRSIAISWQSSNRKKFQFVRFVTRPVDLHLGFIGTKVFWFFSLIQMVFFSNLLMLIFYLYCNNIEVPSDDIFDQCDILPQPWTLDHRWSNSKFELSLWEAFSLRDILHSRTFWMVGNCWTNSPWNSYRIPYSFHWIILKLKSLKQIASEFPEPQRAFSNRSLRDCVREHALVVHDIINLIIQGEFIGLWLVNPQKAK